MFILKYLANFLFVAILLGAQIWINAADTLPSPNLACAQEKPFSAGIENTSIESLMEALKKAKAQSTEPEKEIVGLEPRQDLFSNTKPERQALQVALLTQFCLAKRCSAQLAMQRKHISAFSQHFEKEEKLFDNILEKMGILGQQEACICSIQALTLENILQHNEEIEEEAYKSKNEKAFILLKCLIVDIENTFLDILSLQLSVCTEILAAETSWEHTTSLVHSVADVLCLIVDITSSADHVVYFLDNGAVDAFDKDVQMLRSFILQYYQKSCQDIWRYILRLVKGFQMHTSKALSEKQKEDMRLQAQALCMLVCKPHTLGVDFGSYYKVYIQPVEDIFLESTSLIDRSEYEEFLSNHRTKRQDLVLNGKFIDMCSSLFFLAQDYSSGIEELASNIEDAAKERDINLLDSSSAQKKIEESPPHTYISRLATQNIGNSLRRQLALLTRIEKDTVSFPQRDSTFGTLYLDMSANIALRTFTEHERLKSIWDALQEVDRYNDSRNSFSA
ncbi:hypothetical protein NECID01_1300 [Nematocida sp. AWRm77]|nr:hypothetical protein NECID01_1300 [Nematocida sp. AWRm77]